MKRFLLCSLAVCALALAALPAAFAAEAPEPAPTCKRDVLDKADAVSASVAMATCTAAAQQAEADMARSVKRTEPVRYVIPPLDRPARRERPEMSGSWRMVPSTG